MLTPKQLSNGEFLHAEYYEWDKKEREYKAPVKFRYKTFDDAQTRQYMTQRMQGTIAPKYSVSIQTSVDLPFKTTNDKVKILKNGNTYKITAVNDVDNHPNVIMNTIFPLVNGNTPKRIHLNKEE